MNCADTWIQASPATADYYNTCGFYDISKVYGPGNWVVPSFPLPGNGAAFAGFVSNGSYLEFIGACLSSPMVAGTTYVINLWMARGNGNQDLKFTVYGTKTCSDLPWSGYSCPIGQGSWEILGQTWVNMPVLSDWYEVTVSFTPTEDIYAVAMGSDCIAPTMVSNNNAYYVDELTLANSEEFVC